MLSSNREKKQYQQLVEQKSPKTPLFRNMVVAFIVGGLICILGQILINYFIDRGMNLQDARGAETVILVFLAALFTGLGWYDRLGEFAGAGSIVPITGFANSIVSPAMEFKREGYVLGVGARMFTVAGPVLVYGTVISFFVGVITWLF